MRRGRVIGGGVLFLLLSLGGCKQGVGDRCQLLSDCQDTLICCVGPRLVDKQIGGFCTLPGKCELPSSADIGVHLEARVGDGARDALKDKGGDKTADRSTTAADKAPATPDAKTGQ